MLGTEPLTVCAEDFTFNYACVWEFVDMNAGSRGGQEEGSRSFRAVPCELASMGAGKQTKVLCRSRVCPS